MDDYQEELLEYQAFELDPLEPAEDATELVGIRRIGDDCGEIRRASARSSV